MEIMLTTSRRTLTEMNTEEDLIPPGAKPGTVPTDVDHATGIERLELIGKMQGIDIFDMRPLDASRKGMFRPRFVVYISHWVADWRWILAGTLEDPIVVSGAGDEQYAGCTGYPADSHQVNWLTVSIYCVNPGQIMNTNVLL